LDDVPEGVALAGVGDHRDLQALGGGGHSTSAALGGAVLRLLATGTAASGDDQGTCGEQGCCRAGGTHAGSAFSPGRPVAAGSVSTAAAQPRQDFVRTF